MKKINFDVDEIRIQFPGLARSYNGHSAAFFDGPGGSQVPVGVVEKINDYLYYRNANCHGTFKTSEENDRVYWEARETVADFLNCQAKEVVFGANTSSNNFRLAFSCLRTFIESGDEIIITEIDHEANRSPWRTLEDFGAVIKVVNVNPETCMLDFDHYKSLLTDKTKVVAVNWAANACGTITDVKKYIELAHEYNAIAVIDAVHYAAHKSINVKEIGADVLLCSAYKFFGPHIGIMYIEESLGDLLNAVRIMADDNYDMPFKMETGTNAVELACGAAGAVEFIADIGKRYENHFEDELGELVGRRRHIVAGMHAIDCHEEDLSQQFRQALQAMEGVKMYASPKDELKTPTVSFVVEGVNAHEVAQHLYNDGIFVWDGNFYALHIIDRVFGLEDSGGLVRVGFAPYNTQSELDRLIQSLQNFIDGRKIDGRK